MENLERRRDSSRREREIMRRKPSLGLCLKRNRRVILGLSLCLGLGVLANACIPYRPFTLPNEELAALQQSDPKEAQKYRRSVRPCTDLTEDANDPALTNQCTFSIVEFDDQGELWKPAQLDDTLALIESKSHRPAEGTAGEARKALVVVFVHGWKNNASPDNEANRNLGSFKKVLLRLAQEELNKERNSGNPSRDVVGVYLSWRGRASNNWLLSQLSFFSRKNAAERVARVSFSHAIQRIISSTKGTRSGLRGNPESIAVVVGHSFGGLIVENTLLRTLTVETDDFSEFGADLAVLVNPANEAILARQFVQALQGAPARPLNLGGQTVSEPLIVSVTSVSDSATGKFFPLGLTLKSVGKRFHKYEDGDPGIQRQKFYYTHTPGHSTPEGALYSHAVNCPLEPDGCTEAPTTGQAFDAAMARRIATMRQHSSQQTIFPAPAVKLGPCRRDWEATKEYRCIDNLWFVGAVTGDLYAVNRDLSSPNQTGYWIMELPSTIVASHSDIFQSELASLLAAFINLPQARVVEDMNAAESYLQELFPGDP